MKKFGFTLIELLVVISIIALLLGILVPVLGIAKKNANIMKESVNIRNMNLGMNTYGGTNKDWFPGLNSAGKFGSAFSGEYYSALTTVTTSSGAGASVGSDNNTALAILLEEGQVAPAQLQSPGENGANSATTGPVVFTQATPDPTPSQKAGSTAATGLVTKENSSFALLQYGESKLKSEWKGNQNQQAVIAGARLIFTDGATAVGDKFSSLWTDSLSAKYKGAIAHGDNSTNTETFSKAEIVDTTAPYFANLKYGSTVFSATGATATEVGVFGKSASGMANYSGAAADGQLGSEID
jgi:prepilin-type N-terminal cleavage/methylation domain-containing protein